MPIRLYKREVGDEHEFGRMAAVYCTPAPDSYRCSCGSHSIRGGFIEICQTQDFDELKSSKDLLFIIDQCASDVCSRAGAWLRTSCKVRLPDGPVWLADHSRPPARHTNGQTILLRQPSRQPNSITISYYLRSANVDISCQ